MILTPLLMLAAMAQDVTGQDPPDRLPACLALAASDPVAAESEAGRWRTSGGGFRARACLGAAYANQQRWTSAAGAFEEAAREAEVARDTRSADYWAKAGNAWLAAGEAAKARAALDAALASATLLGVALGEAHLDRARALVAMRDMAGARSDLDRALVQAAEDPLAWLLSATLARRMGELPRARADIAEALRRSPDSPSIQLEAGNIAALDGDEARARAAWERVIALAPGTPMATAAQGALSQFAPQQ